ncbi:MAG: DUF4364 family protein [Clostridia bacterium]|nr:DUF4364 family protein [Clostridia bacterium]
MYLEKEEMKFAAVYAIKQYKVPMGVSRIYEIFTWDKEIMEYFDLSGVLAELLEDKYIYQKYYRNEESLCLTDRGEEAYTFFKNRIPYSIRERIDSAIGKIKYDEIADPNAVKAEVVLAAEEQYMAKCSINENKVPVLELSLNMGKRNHAERVAEYFKKNANKIYEEILKLCFEER